MNLIDRLSWQERKLILICAGGLATAGVCFGLLSSSGTFRNGVWDLGGAIAGFAAAALILNYAYGPPPSLEKKAEDEGSELIVDEMVKVLDLRRADPSDDPQRAELHDYYRARRTKTSEPRLTARYQTSGYMKFLGSPTHPGVAYAWNSEDSGLTKADPDHNGLAGERFENAYRLDFDVSASKPGETVQIKTEIAWFNGFRQKDRESLETHITYPTGWLSMLVLMPDTMRCISATGLVRGGQGDPKATATQATVLLGGSLVYWSVDKPDLYARYGMIWTWERGPEDRDRSIVKP